MISPEEAWERLLPHLATVPSQRVRRDSATGRMLAEGLAATVDVPFADVSAMDGYALAGEQPAGLSVPVVAAVAAGVLPSLVLTSGTAARIMTGAALPAGADRVAPIEETDGGVEQVVLRRAPAAGAHVRRRGEISRRGEPLLGAGEMLTPGALALLAAHGHEQVSVPAPPRVAVLITGDEVVPADTAPGPGQLRDSHGAFLGAGIQGAGAKMESLGICGDDPGLLRDRLAQGLDADMLLVTGGVSHGAFDFVEGALATLGFRPLFDSVAIQPGGPLYAAVRPGNGGRRGGLAIGLPGNPAAVMVCYWLFVRPALRRLQGFDDGFWQGALEGISVAPLPGAGARERYVPARIVPRRGVLEVTPLAPSGSHDLGAYGHGTGLVRLRARALPSPAGTPCSVLPLLGEWG